MQTSTPCFAEVMAFLSRSNRRDLYQGSKEEEVSQLQEEARLVLEPQAAWFLA